MHEPHDHGAHGHGHHHGGNHHGHSHGHHHGHSRVTTNLKFAFLLNLGFSLVEIAGGIWTGSVAILSDALHDFGDALAIGIAYLLERMADKRSNQKYSYGYRRVSLLSALLTGAVLLVASAFVLS